MSVAAPPDPPLPAVRRWTRSEYYRMDDLGLFQDQRVQLVDGEILIISPQKWPHASTVDRVADLLDSLFGSDAWVRTRLPLALGPISEPEPDISVVAGAREDYTDHPTTALLVVEVSDTTVSFDRARKAALYSQAGIADYWIVNLVARQVEVHRNPDSGDDQSDAIYQSVSIHRPGEAVAPLERPDSPIQVADLLS